MAMRSDGMLKTAMNGASGYLADSHRESSGFQTPTMFERADWVRFGDLTTLPEMSGVGNDLLPRLVVKELVDNALDATGSAEVGLLNNLWVFVQDAGRGIGGTDDEIAGLFSIGRPLVSSKLWRLPTRGALGNGLRVVAGAVLASGGELIVSTRGRTLRLIPRDDGGTSAESIGTYSGPGTRVQVHLGRPLVLDDDALRWGRAAILMATEGGKRYEKNTSPHWYDTDTFHGLLRAAKGSTVRQVIARFDGCTEPKAGRIAGPYKGRPAGELDRAEASSLLAVARSYARVVDAKHLGCVGPIAGLPSGYAKLADMMDLPATRSGGTSVPVVVEAWAEPADEPSFTVFVNRTPVATDATEARLDKADLSLFGCGIAHRFENVGRRAPRVILNVEAPYMPIVTGGKEPDLKPIVTAIYKVVPLAIKRGKGRGKAGGRGEPGEMTQKDAILACLEDAIESTGGGGGYEQRQLYYTSRDLVKKLYGVKEPEFGWWCQVITEYENELGHDLPGIVRDNRGTLYHPHTGELIPLGTRSVRAYSRPGFLFNKVLYCEKEGFFAAMKEARWPERNDCALLTSKGYASRACRDVIDLLGETDEPIAFYCVHDGDAAGTMIYQSLASATKARPARKVEVINLGLEPWEGLEMGLSVEPVDRSGGKRQAVADYVDEHAGEGGIDDWQGWLQTNRIELNAMTTPKFIAWLDAKFAPFKGKVLPPAAILGEQLRREVRSGLEGQITERVLREARVPDQVDRELRARVGAIERDLETIAEDVEGHLEMNPAALWTAPVREIAEHIVGPTAGS